MVKKQFCNGNCNKGVTKRNKMVVLSKPVDYHWDCILEGFYETYLYLAKHNQEQAVVGVTLGKELFQIYLFSKLHNFCHIKLNIFFSFHARKNTNRVFWRLLGRLSVLQYFQNVIQLTSFSQDHFLPNEQFFLIFQQAILILIHRYYSRVHN